MRASTKSVARKTTTTTIKQVRDKRTKIYELSLERQTNRETMIHRKNDKYDITQSHQHLFESAAPSSSSFSSKSNKHYAHRQHNATDGANGNGSSALTAVAAAAVDLTLVGYSSNLYRDDMTAMKLESKSHLIPWNGDETLLIDRYVYIISVCCCCCCNRKRSADCSVCIIIKLRLSLVFVRLERV